MSLETLSVPEIFTQTPVRSPAYPVGRMGHNKPTPELLDVMGSPGLLLPPFQARPRSSRVPAIAAQGHTAGRAAAGV